VFGLFNGNLFHGTLTECFQSGLKWNFVNVKQFKVLIHFALFSLCSVAYVSRSGGMSNELNNIISLNTDGVFEGIAIGGDR